MIIKIVNKIISKVKKESFYLDPQINTIDVIALIYDKSKELIRGFFLKLRFKGSKKRLFIGCKTKIKHKSHIVLGDSIQIKDYVEINGLCKHGIRIGDNASIGKYTIIRGTGSIKNLGYGLELGKNFGCGDFCFFGCSGGIKIGDNVIMGQNVRFHSQNHNFERIDIPIKNQGVNSKGIIVGDDCWIGAGTTILDGVKIGRGCVIGANTLINSEIPEYSVVVGNPFRIIKIRS
ncbi:acyltransferase [Clostridium perfringens]|nr:acyltransferase [Clostridium perfringens]